ncbi:uncharacterized protein [Aegilops tauschii subsp. strangulata]|uniref:uncharacterized protein n=1 Tax=Aegilops tauschii subsp. strangulata TaxID=200361 RepID=UPI003CC894FD
MEFFLTSFSCLTQPYRDTVATTYSNCSEGNAGPSEVRLGYPLPGVEGFHIDGNPRPGFTLTACCFPTKGATMGIFQWVRYFEDGTRQPIEGATMYEYMVTADAVGAHLAAECFPMDDIGRQGDLVRPFVNSEYKITSDEDIQNYITICISVGRADFDVFVLQGYSPDEWKKATLVLTQTGYQINFSHKNEAVIDHKYTPNLHIEVPNGRTTQFVLLTSGGVNHTFETRGVTGHNDVDNDVRLRDLIILVLRTFQYKADEEGAIVSALSNVIAAVDPWRR